MCNYDEGPLEGWEVVFLSILERREIVRVLS